MSSTLGSTSGELGCRTLRPFALHHRDNGEAGRMRGQSSLPQPNIPVYSTKVHYLGHADLVNFISGEQ